MASVQTEKSREKFNALIRKGKKSPMPDLVPPMLATLHSTVFNDKGWLFEIKWDGYRALARIDGENTRLSSRNHQSMKQFALVNQALSSLGIRAVLDGELVVLNQKGLSDFQLLQSWTAQKEGQLCYMVFDLIWVDGYLITMLPLMERKKILQGILNENKTIRYCDHIVETGIDFYKQATKKGLEGIIAKKAESEYLPGVRSRNWLKLKNKQITDAVIIGFTEGLDGRNYFGSLLLAGYKDRKLVYTGRVGTGMDVKTRKYLMERIRPLIIEDCPLDQIPVIRHAVTWVKPALVCSVRFQEYTRKGLLRIPVFQTLRTDKTIREIKKESETGK
jgi:bifunctional non-homologous end joining protein LigD